MDHLQPLPSLAIPDKMLKPKSVLFRSAAILWLLGSFMNPSATAAPTRQIEYELKAGFIYNFAKFIEWPPPPLASGSIFRVGVLKDESIHAIIEGALKGKMIGDHPIEVVLLNDEDDLSGCRVLFIPKTSALNPTQLREKMPNVAVLLVGEKDGFASSGGDIGFIPRGDNLRYQVNLAEAQRTGFKLSARLASLAEIVRSSKQ